MEKNNLIVRLATSEDFQYAETITNEMEESAKARGTGIAKRSPAYIQKKMAEGKSIIALTQEGTWVGFCYIEAWEHDKYVANSGLIVSPSFRKTGVATEIKKAIFNLSRANYPQAKIFGLTTGLAVMKINSDLGYEPVTYSELTNDEEFWKGCQSCVNYEILMSKGRKNCLCTGMLFDPVEAEIKAKALLQQPAFGSAPASTKTEQALVHHREFYANTKLYERWLRFKQFVLLKPFRKKEEESGTTADKRKTFLSIFFW